MFYQLAAASTYSGNSVSLEEHSQPEGHSHPDGALRKLWKDSSVRLFKAGQHVFRAGDAQLDLYKVVAGTIRLYKNLKDGRRQVIGFLVAGDLIGLELQPRHLCNAQAISSASLQSVPVATVHALALADAGMLSELYASLSNEMAAVQDLALTIGRADPEERLARFLLVLSRRNQRHGRDPTGIDLSMPRIDIADHSTASRGIYFRFTIDAPGENPDAPGAVLPFGANLSFAMNSWPGANPEAPLAPPEFPRCA